MSNTTSVSRHRERPGSHRQPCMHMDDPSQRMRKEADFPSAGFVLSGGDSGRLRPIPIRAWCHCAAWIGVYVAVSVAAAAGGMDAAQLDPIDTLMSEAISEGQCAGGVVLVGQGDRTIYRRAFGHQALEPDKIEMKVDTIFDMASITKVVATATSVMVLIDRGEVSLHDLATKYIPEFAPEGKDGITVEHLLIHRAGLTPDNHLRDYADGPAEAMRRIYDLGLRAKPGEEFIYSDVGYIVLGEIVRRVSGMPLDEFARRNIFEPAGMNDATFMPPKSVHARCAVQEKREGEWIIGEVHDPRACALGGVAGHAGLFGTADDLARYCRMILNGGSIDGLRILSPLAVRAMVRPRPAGASRGVRGLGFDIATGYSSARGDLFDPHRSFGHTGFTGTSMWIDPTTDTYVIILTNRLHPDGKGNVIPLRRQIATVVASAVETDAFAFTEPPHASCGADDASSRARDTRVMTGLDVLVRDGFKPLRGKRVGVITNHTGLSREGKHIVSLLAEQDDIELVALFAPEHGFEGVLDRHIENQKDQLTGLTIYSLYGKTRTPTDEMLEGVDTLVFDIQDIGARFYTYIATMGNAMQAAAKHGIHYVVLDRPNPITGRYVAGPIADADKLGFTAFWRLPVAHGMTIGELARMFNEEMKIGADLTVIQLENWSRDQWYDETGLLWVNPSPNMRNMTQAILYPGVCLIEASNLSVGRGTDEPFERFGAPWVDARKFAAAMNRQGLAGVRFVPIEFVPTSSKFANETCGGVHVLVTDRDAIDSVRVGTAIAWQLRQLYPDAFEFDNVNRLLVNDRALAALKDAKSPIGVERAWRDDLNRFERIRRNYLMYH